MLTRLLCNVYDPENTISSRKSSYLLALKSWEVDHSCWVGISHSSAEHRRPLCVRYTPHNSPLSNGALWVKVLLPGKQCSQKCRTFNMGNVPLGWDSTQRSLGDSIHSQENLWDCSLSPRLVKGYCQTEGATDCVVIKESVTPFPFQQAKRILGIISVLSQHLMIHFNFSVQYPKELVWHSQ